MKPIFNPPKDTNPKTRNLSRNYTGTFKENILKIFPKIDLRKIIKCTFRQLYNYVSTDLMLQKNSLLSSHFFFLKNKKLLRWIFRENLEHATSIKSSFSEILQSSIRLNHMKLQTSNNFLLIQWQLHMVLPNI